jgi:hypothetical protein
MADIADSVIVNTEMSPINIGLSCEQAGKRKQKLWLAWQNWQRRIIRAFYPATGGSEHLMHNWHCCSLDLDDSLRACWIKESTWARLRRLDARLEQRDAKREHLRHQGTMRANWCIYCQKGVSL